MPPLFATQRDFDTAYSKAFKNGVTDIVPYLLTIDGTFLAYIRPSGNQKEYFSNCLIAVKQWGMSIRFVNKGYLSPKQYQEVALEAVHQYPSSISEVHERYITPAMAMFAVDYDCNLLPFIPPTIESYNEILMLCPAPKGKGRK